MTSSDGAALDTSYLDVEIELPVSVEEMLSPNFYVGLEIGLLAPGDGVVTDWHQVSPDRYETDDPMNPVVDQISPFALSGWMQYGGKRVLQALSESARHPRKAKAETMLSLPC